MLHYPGGRYDRGPTQDPLLGSPPGVIVRPLVQYEGALSLVHNLYFSFLYHHNSTEPLYLNFVKHFERRSGRGAGTPVH